MQYNKGHGTCSIFFDTDVFHMLYISLMRNTRETVGTIYSLTFVFLVPL